MPALSLSTIAFTVCPKADSLFKIVGAASIAAKVLSFSLFDLHRDPRL